MASDCCTSIGAGKSTRSITEIQNFSVRCIIKSNRVILTEAGNSSAGDDLHCSSDAPERSVGHGRLTGENH